MLSLRKSPRNLAVGQSPRARGRSAPCAGGLVYKTSSLSFARLHQRRVLFTSEANSTNPASLSCLTGLSYTSTLRPRSNPSSVMATLTHTRTHAGHSHHHGHSHDNTYLVSKNKNDAGVRVTRLGLYVNFGMAISKGIGGVYFNSQALVADAFHALTDLVSDFMTLATISVALKPPTAQYPNGFGKVESFGSLMVSGLLLTGGLLMCANAGSTLYTQFFAEAAQHVHHAAEAGDHSHGIFHSHSHNAADMVPNINAAWLAAGSIVVKEYLYRITMKIAKERKSSVLASNAVHHRVDSLTSIVALVAIGGSHLLQGATWLDPVGGLIVSLMVIQAGFGNSVQAIYELCDASIEDEVKESVKKAASGAISPENVEIRHVSGIKAGQNYLLDIEVALSGASNLAQMQNIEDKIRERVGSKVRGARRIRIRFVPKEKALQDFSDEFIGADVSPRSSPEPEDDHDHHDHRHDHHNHHDHINSSIKPMQNGTATKRR